MQLANNTIQKENLSPVPRFKMGEPNVKMYIERLINMLSLEIIETTFYSYEIPI